MSRNSTFVKLQENTEEVYKEVFHILLKILDNVIKAPTNLKYRKLRLANEIVLNKLIPAIGALECLFEFGFEEADEFLMLPQRIPLEEIRRIREEFDQCHKEYLVQFSRNTSAKVLNQVILFDEIKSISKQVLLYENEDLQSAARNVIPIDELKQRSSKLDSDNDPFLKEFGLIYELMRWFKTDFFQWMDAPKCGKCNSSSNFQGYSRRPEDLAKTSRVEEYSCQKCSDRLIFPRYNDPSVLLKTRSGRCGEWANCFCLLCRSLGYETRYIIDKTDHVWAEVFSKTLSRWIHCDPCENAIDTPLMYEKGWNKKLSYVFAISCEEIQDVTWRYTTEFEQVRPRRKLCREEDLVSFILKLSNELQASLPETRKTYLTTRRLAECISMLTPASVDGDYSGRTSGSLQWRLSRNECKQFTPKHYVWEPNVIEALGKKFGMKYSSSKDVYIRTGNSEIIKGWENGVYECESIFRKEEPDWKISYLCRIEGSDSGTIKWKFSSQKMSVKIDCVLIKYNCSTFENGKIRWILCNDETCLPLQTNENFNTIYSFQGSYDLTLTATLTGGNGDNAWQHAQLFRQPLDNDEFSFEIIITFFNN